MGCIPNERTVNPTVIMSESIAHTAYRIPRNIGELRHGRIVEVRRLFRNALHARMNAVDDVARRGRPLIYELLTAEIELI